MAKASTKTAPTPKTGKGHKATPQSGAATLNADTGSDGIAPELSPSPDKKGASERHEWPACNPELREVRLLVGSARNARTHSDRQVNELVALIQKFGWTQPVLVDEQGGIIAGHGRVLAAKKLGLARIPVIVAAGWSDLDKRAYMLADNQVPQNAGWDLKLLSEELAELGSEGYDVPTLGFDQSFIDGIGGGYVSGVSENEADELRSLGGMPRYPAESAGSGVANSATSPQRQAEPADGHAYRPVLEPERAMSSVTQNDVAAAAQQLQQRPVEQAQSDLVEVICPHCGESYDIDRKSLG